MPIYEYQAKEASVACSRCAGPFEVLQGINEQPLDFCPNCGADVVRLISWCRAAVVEGCEEHERVNRTIRDYENAGMWSHAAELADSHSEKTGDSGLKGRALDNYKKAGYDVDSLIRDSKL